MLFGLKYFIQRSQIAFSWLILPEVMFSQSPEQKKLENPKFEILLISYVSLRNEKSENNTDKEKSRN